LAKEDVRGKAAEPPMLPAGEDDEVGEDKAVLPEAEGPRDGGLSGGSGCAPPARLPSTVPPEKLPLLIVSLPSPGC